MIRLLVRLWRWFLGPPLNDYPACADTCVALQSVLLEVRSLRVEVREYNRNVMVLFSNGSGNTPTPREMPRIDP